MSGQLLQRARLLRERRRFEDAIAALHESLASEPECFITYYELAVTRLLGGVDYRQGLRDIERALSISPDSAAAHSIRSAILHAMGRFQDALLAAGKAKRLDPELPYAWFCEGNALLGLGEFSSAETATRKALELDPDHPAAPNLLTAALRSQQRFGEAEQVARRHLERDPENAWTFANAGWTALEQGQRDKAENLFREALRLEPGVELARLGLRDAFKARSLFYRLHLRHVAFMRRGSEAIGWLVSIPMLVGFLSVLVILANLHPVAVGLFVGCFLVIFGPFLANGVGHLLLVMDRFARHSLNRGEKLDGLLVGVLLVGGMAVLILGTAVRSVGVVSLGGAMMGAAVPGSFVFVNRSTKGGMFFGLVSLAVVGCGIRALLLGSDDPEAAVWAIAAMLIVFVCPQISTSAALKR
jgi:Tfp pilus assembly protein PilF